MKNQLKITLFLMQSSRFFGTLISIILMTSCFQSSNKYLKNKFEIKSFSVTESILGYELFFNVNYYSDSLYTNFFVESIEKGQDGSDVEILYLGELKKSDSVIFGKNNCVDLNQFVEDFNNKKNV